MPHFELIESSYYFFYELSFFCAPIKILQSD